MVDIENQVIEAIADVLETEYPGIAIESGTSQNPSIFPCVNIYEADNFVYSSTVDSSGDENHSEVMYELNVYTNEQTGKKSKCKEIFHKADEVLNNLGFMRTSTNPISLDDATKYRIAGRYIAVISKNEVIYRR